LILNLKRAAQPVCLLSVREIYFIGSTDPKTSGIVAMLSLATRCDPWSVLSGDAQKSRNGNKSAWQSVVVSTVSGALSAIADRWHAASCAGLQQRNRPLAAPVAALNRLH
jgi:hypothetical protein